jgi:hypothetical protein
MNRHVAFAKPVESDQSGHRPDRNPALQQSVVGLFDYGEEFLRSRSRFSARLANSS